MKHLWISTAAFVFCLLCRLGLSSALADEEASRSMNKSRVSSAKASLMTMGQEFWRMSRAIRRITGEQKNNRKYMKSTNAFAFSSFGRILLHAGCLLRQPQHFAWHWRGILRELRFDQGCSTERP